MKTKTTELLLNNLVRDLLLMNTVLVLVALTGFQTRIWNSEISVYYFLHANLSVIIIFLRLFQLNPYQNNVALSQLMIVCKLLGVFIIMATGFTYISAHLGFALRTPLESFILFFLTESLFYWLSIYLLKNTNNMGFNVNNIPIAQHKSSNFLLKQIFDVLFSSFVILFLFSWLFPILALLIKIDSKGPVFFTQKRTGLNNQTFECLKFRSMTVNKCADDKQATANDCRITRFGRFMRKTNIDELPQFINVLEGSMSVVGPRPHMLKHTEQYSALIDNYLDRHKVLPGISGLAQVSGFRGETKLVSSMENRVNADIKYIKKWSLALDMKIVWATVCSKKCYVNAA